MNDPLLLGIDLGTTRIKVGAFSLQGTELGHSAVVLTSAHSWWTCVKQAIRACLHELDTSRVGAICIGGQGPTLVTVDAEANLLGEPISYDDPRAAIEASDLSIRLGRNLSVRGSYLPRVVWLQKHDPDRYAATRWFLQAWDYLILKLSGSAVATSPGGIYDPWPRADLARLGLVHERFPLPARLGKIAATVASNAALESGLPEGTSIVAGGGDFLLSTMGVGGTQKGVAQSQGGASSAFTLCWDRPLQGNEIAWSIPSPIDPALYNCGGPITTGGAALDWLMRDLLDSGAEYEDLLGSAARVAPGSDGLVFLPYLAGEEHIGPHLRGAFLGLSLAHRKPHMIRAVLEGVSLAAKSILSSLLAAGGQPEQVIVAGGQSRSALWNQIKADVWGLPVVTPSIEDPGCLGAAAIAATGLGFYTSLKDASRYMAHSGSHFLPRTEQAAFYQEEFRLFTKLLRHHVELCRELGQLSKDATL
jgi:xylulokinase